MKEYLILILIGIIVCEDPFTLLGIPSLNPSTLFRQDNSQLRKKVSVKRNKVPNTFDINNNFSFIQNKDIIKKEPKVIVENNNEKPSQIIQMIESSGLSPENGIQAVSRFLLTKNPQLYNYGAIFDKTQYSGISENEMISFDLYERNKQKVMSAANLYFINTLNNNGYQAVDAKEDFQTKIHGWNIYNVLLKNKFNNNDQAYLTICYPMDNMLVPIAVQSKNCSKEVS